MDEYVLLNASSVCIDTHQNRLSLSDEIANAIQDKIGATPKDKSPYENVSYSRITTERRAAISRLFVKQADELGRSIDKMLKPSQQELRERNKCLNLPSAVTAKIIKPNKI